MAVIAVRQLTGALLWLVISGVVAPMASAANGATSAAVSGEAASWENGTGDRAVAERETLGVPAEIAVSMGTGKAMPVEFTAWLI